MPRAQAAVRHHDETVMPELRSRLAWAAGVADGQRRVHDGRRTASAGTCVAQIDAMVRPLGTAREPWARFCLDECGLSTVGLGLLVRTKGANPLPGLLLLDDLGHSALGRCWPGLWWEQPLPGVPLRSVSRRSGVAPVAGRTAASRGQGGLVRPGPRGPAEAVWSPRSCLRPTGESCHRALAQSARRWGGRSRVPWRHSTGRRPRTRRSVREAATGAAQTKHLT